MTAKDSAVEREGVAAELAEVARGMSEGTVIPYVGPGVLAAGDSTEATVPAGPAALAQYLCGQVAVPSRIRGNVTAVAQYIENFKHRKTLTSLMSGAFGHAPDPSAIHHRLRHLAGRGSLPLVVDAWYDRTTQDALAGLGSWGQIQGVSRAEHPHAWYRCLRADGRPAGTDDVGRWDTVLYKPLGSIAPEANFVVSDSDFVEILTEIDIQTPIPNVVRERRAGRHFLFLGCRFDTQLERIFARQTMKRSSALHWAVLPEPPTRNAQRFLDEQGIVRITTTLIELAQALAPV